MSSKQIPVTILLLGVFTLVPSVFAQGQSCYFGKGAANRGPAELVPCGGVGSTSTCCLLGDVCLSGNACYNGDTGNTYQYGCSDINYEDESCPFKCGSSSPWVGLDLCKSNGDNSTWVCQSPESCGCEWNSTYQLLTLAPRTCEDMGDLALVAIQGAASLAPYVQLPSTAGGSTGYFSPTKISGTPTWVSTVIDGYTPSIIAPLTTVSPGPSSAIEVFPGKKPGPATYAAAQVPDDESVTSATVSGSLGGSRSSQTSSASSSSSSPFTQNNSSSSGLSTGAKIGIALGVVLGVLTLIGIAFMYVLARRLRRVRQEQQRQQQTPQQPPYSPSLGHQEYTGSTPMQPSQWSSPAQTFAQPYYEAEKKAYPSPEAPAASFPPVELANTEVRGEYELHSESSSPAPETQRRSLVASLASRMK